MIDTINLEKETVKEMLGGKYDYIDSNIKNKFLANKVITLLMK